VTPEGRKKRTGLKTGHSTKEKSLRAKGPSYSYEVTLLRLLARKARREEPLGVIIT
jgi:hypothetical protein